MKEPHLLSYKSVYLSSCLSDHKTLYKHDWVWLYNQKYTVWCYSNNALHCKYFNSEILNLLTGKWAGLSFIWFICVFGSNPVTSCTGWHYATCNCNSKSKCTSLFCIYPVSFDEICMHFVVSFYIGVQDFHIAEYRPVCNPSSMPPLAIKKGIHDFTTPALESCICYGPSNLLCKPCGREEV